MEDREIRKQRLQREKDEIIKRIQILAAQVIKDNNGNDIKITCAKN
jgi:hypothetical protein